VAIVLRQLARFCKHCPDRFKELAFKMRDEMQALFKKMGDMFIVICINLLTATVTEFSRKLVTAILANNSC
jgi:hypothetical protein